MHRVKIAVLGVVMVMSGACKELFPPADESGHEQQQQQQNPQGNGQPQNGQPKDSQPQGNGQPQGGQPVSDSVVSIEILPAGASVVSGSRTQFTAILKNSAGQPLTGHPVTWSTASNAVASVNSNGVATANEPGATTVTASSKGKTATTTLSVSAVPVATWGNEPPGLATISDNPLDTLSAAGWGTSWNENGWIVAAADPERGRVLRWNYPTGFTGGRGPGMEYLYHTPAKEVFAGYWFKASDPWQPHPSLVHKMAFWYTSSGECIYIQMYGESPHRMDAATCFYGGITWLPANMARSPMKEGVWHKVELHARYASSANSADGIIEWWLDGVLQGRYTNIQTPADDGFAQFQISPTWGGYGGVKTEDDYYLYDDIHLSGR